MEISGRVVKIESEFIRILTRKKNQEIDIYFTESKRVAIHDWLEPQISVSVEVESESIDLNGMKLAKLWFVFGVRPEPQKEIFIHNEPLRKRKNLILTLFRKDYDSAK